MKKTADNEGIFHYNVKDVIKEIEKLAQNEKAVFGKNPKYTKFLSLLKTWLTMTDKLEDVWDDLDTNYPF